MISPTAQDRQELRHERKASLPKASASINVDPLVKDTGAWKRVAGWAGWKTAPRLLAEVGYSWVIALILIVAATVIGVYGTRVLAGRPSDLVEALDLMVRTRMPSVDEFFLTGVAAGLMAVPFFKRHLRYAGDGAGTRRLALMITGLMGIVLLDLLFLHIKLPLIVSGERSILDKRPFIQQALALISLLLLIPLHRKMVRIQPLTLTLIPGRYQTIVGVVRLLVVSALLVLVCSWLTAYSFAPAGIDWDTIPFIKLEMIWQTYRMGGLTTAVAVAGLLYRLPPIYEARQRFTLAHLLAIIIGVALTFFQYSQAEDPLTFVNAIVFSGIAAMLLTPVQRALT